MPTPSQIRAARGLLNWSQKDLADRAGVTEATVRNAEKDDATPNSKTLERVARALELSGVLLTENEGVMRAQAIKTLVGENATNDLLDDVFFTLKNIGGETIISGLSEPTLEDQQKYNFEYLLDHIERLKNYRITERILLKEGDTNFLAPKEWYRWIKEEYFSPYPFQAYGDKIALIDWGPPKKIIIIENKFFSKTFKNFFDFAWNHSSLPKDKVIE